jgi:hypothetical protein
MCFDKKKYKSIEMYIAHTSMLFIARELVISVATEPHTIVKCRNTRK